MYERSRTYALIVPSSRLDNATVQSYGTWQGLLDQVRDGQQVVKIFYSSFRQELEQENGVEWLLSRLLGTIPPPVRKQAVPIPTRMWRRPRRRRMPAESSWRRRGLFQARAVRR